MKNPKWEATKTILRPFTFAIIIAIIETLLQQLKVWKLDPVSVTLITTVLTWADNYLYEKRKMEKKYLDGEKINGLLHF